MDNFLILRIAPDRNQSLVVSILILSACSLYYLINIFTKATSWVRFIPVTQTIMPKVALIIQQHHIKIAATTIVMLDEQQKIINNQ